LTKIKFSKLYLDKHDTARISRHDLAGGFSELLEADTRRRTAYRRSGQLSGSSGAVGAEHDSSPIADRGDC
jgi:hypothetical protein